MFQDAQDNYRFRSTTDDLTESLRYILLNHDNQTCPHATSDRSISII